MKEPRELWEEAGGDAERYLELMRQHGHIVPVEECPTCGEATRHRHEADGRLVRTDIFGHDA